jgi:predicted AAA+ superfamily ATPase
MQETVISLTSLFWVILQSYNVYEAFSKSGTQSVSGQPQEGVNSLVNTSIDVLVHSLVDRIDMLESSIKERKRHRSST